jgi:hypothetical protein
MPGGDDGHITVVDETGIRLQLGKIYDFRFTQWHGECIRDHAISGLRLYLLFGKRIPVWAKNAINAWQTSAKIEDGRLLRPLSKSGRILGEELGDWAIWSVVEGSAKEIAIEHFGAHDLRRTCAKLCRKNGGDLPSQMAGGSRCKDALYRTGKSLGERLLRGFNSKLRDEFLNGEIFYSLKEVQVLAERWRVHDNTIRPHSSLGYRSPAPEARELENNLMGRKEPEIATRFPALHPPNGGYLDMMGPGNFVPVEMLVFGKI